VKEFRARRPYPLEAFAKAFHDFGPSSSVHAVRHQDVGLRERIWRSCTQCTAMSLTNNVFVAILWMGSATAAGSGGPDALWVQVNLQFEHSISSNAIAPIAKSEAAAIWRVYGVELLWSDCESDAALHLDVVVARKQLDPLFDPGSAALGLTNLDGAGGVNGPIRISFDRIESLLQFRSERVPLMHTQEIGRALGRVLGPRTGTRTARITGVSRRHRTDARELPHRRPGATRSAIF
jgi:hypothetical protein